MHIVTSSEQLVVRNSTLEAGIPYLVNDTGAGSLLTDRRPVVCRDGITRPVYRLVKVEPTADRFLDWNREYRDLWFFRGGGFGDLIMLTTLIQVAAARWPAATIRVVTMPEYAPALHCVPCKVRSWPISTASIGDEDGVVFFEGVIEDNPLAREVPGPELFVMHAFGGKLPPVHGQLPPPIYCLMDVERAWADRTYGADRTDVGKRVGVQISASAAARTYPPAFTVRVIEGLLKRGHEVFVFGKPGTVDTSDLPTVKNLADDGLSFRESCAVLATCDCVIVPDSALQHVAGALGVPAVSLWGPFPAVLRVSHNALGVRIEAAGNCSPCFHHESGRNKFPANRPCELAGFCTVLADIPPADILAAVDDVLPEDPFQKLS